MPIMPLADNVEAIERWLNDAINHERAGTFRDIKLERISQFLRHLPPPPAPCTVAGTKGKGSSVRFIEAILLAHGQRTLAFTSPHVASVLERWRIDGVPASAPMIAAACRVVAAHEESLRISLTYFERTFAVACLLAAADPGLFFLCEVGLGGRLDCANVLDAAVTILTHLSHDHRDVLGPTLTHIAREKLAVARPGRPLFIAPQSDDALAAITMILKEYGLEADARFISLTNATSNAELSMPGAHQHDNAATALAAAKMWCPQINETVAWQAMTRTRLAARCQLVRSGARRLLIDGAHNGPSIAATMAVAQKELRSGWRLLIALAKDKEIDAVMDAIPVGITVARCGYDSPRARDESQWPEAARAWPWHDTITAALSAQPIDADLCITGSFYLASAALAALGAQGDLPG